MPNFGTYVPDQRFIGLFVGPSGSGKTCAAVSFQSPAKFGWVHVMDFDMRIGGVYGASWLTETQKKNINYDAYPPRDPELITKVNTFLEGLLMSAKIKQAIPQTLIMDSLTSECFAALTYANPLTHGDVTAKRGKWIGPIQMAGPEDYGVEATVTYSILSFMRTVPIPNVIVSAHVIPVYGKTDPDDKYSATEVIGEKLSVRDKIAANSVGYFDHVFRFDRRLVGNRIRHFVQFRTDLARTAYPWLPDGEQDWTGRNFYEFMFSFKPKEITNEKL